MRVFALPEVPADRPTTVRVHLCPELPDQIDEMLLCEGRATLATSFGSYKFLIIYGQFFSVLKLASSWSFLHDLVRKSPPFHPHVCSPESMRSRSKLCSLDTSPPARSTPLPARPRVSS